MSLFNTSSWLLLILFSTLFGNKLVSGQCLPDQRDLLLQLNQSLSSSSPLIELLYQIFPTETSPLYQLSPTQIPPLKPNNWSLNTDCCSAWVGVTCDKDGHVIGLDLSSEYIIDGIHNSSSLFKLQHLQNLNLSGNSFYNLFNNIFFKLFYVGESPQYIPSGFDRLTNLTNLNMSNSGYSGQIPIEISRLTRLVSLDLSVNPVFSIVPGFPKLKLDDPNLGALIRNLSELRVLRLDGVNLSAVGKKWGQAISSSLPKLQVLSLSNCSLSGPIDKSLLQLRSLYEIRLDGNNISTQVPDFLMEFSNLTSLSLSSCGLYGKFPEKLLQLQTLQSLDLGQNQLRYGSLSELEFPQNGSLQKLVLANTSFFGELPNSIGNLKLLSYLDLWNCGFNGSIPASMAKLDQLQHLNLSHNRLTGPIFFFERLTGPISPSLFTFTSLEELDLSQNNFNGTLSLDMFQKFKNLSSLDLSGNNFSIDTTRVANPAMFPQLKTLNLRSCNLSVFPDFLRNQSILNYLDLSSNQMRGKLPNWIWMTKTLSVLNLSKNFLEDFEQPVLVHIPFLGFVDLSSNMLQGKSSPLLPSYAMFLDYSNNNFNNMIPQNISSYIPNSIFFFLSSNNLTGEIPASICECSSLQVLDLSNNSLSGPIPPCMGTMTSLRVLNLGRNYFHGTIPHMFPKGCSLKTLSLNNNRLVGKVARSLANCRMLQVLDLGNNQINGTFPSWLGNMSYLRVLILRSNRFHGPLRHHRRTTDQNFHMLQIIDISSNKFTGNLSSEFFSSLKAMMINKEDYKTSGENQILRYGVLESLGLYYQDSVTVICKGQNMELVKILKVFISIDLSNNGFEGDIPEVLGGLSSLYILNVSQNALTGRIPSSFGNLTQLESLDLSENKLSGEIPIQLAGLTFLSSLNLSYNHLVGKIPLGTQIQSFNATSFEGNDGLCGPPLFKNCTEPPRISPPPSKSVNEFNWMPVSVASGFGVGIGISICLMTFWGTRVRRSSRH